MPSGSSAARVTRRLLRRVRHPGGARPRVHERRGPAGPGAGRRPQPRACGRAGSASDPAIVGRQITLNGRPLRRHRRDAGGVRLHGRRRRAVGAHRVHAGAQGDARRALPRRSTGASGAGVTADQAIEQMQRQGAAAARRPFHARTCELVVHVGRRAREPDRRLPAGGCSRCSARSASSCSSPAATSPNLLLARGAARGPASWRSAPRSAPAAAGSRVRC